MLCRLDHKQQRNARLCMIHMRYPCDRTAPASVGSTGSDVGVGSTGSGVCAGSTGSDEGVCSTGSVAGVCSTGSGDGVGTTGAATCPDSDVSENVFRQSASASHKLG